jgi:hypothetical protein
MENIISRNKQKIIEICKNHNVQKLAVFGSATTNKFNQNSDVDFLISLNENLKIEEYESIYFEIYEQLQLILGRNIDLVTERTLSNPYLIESINKTKTIIYEA